VSDADSPEARIARWAERDAVVGLDAELHQARAQLAERDAEIATLRQRSEQLANRVAQLTIANDALAHQVAALQQAPVSRRLYRRARSVAGRALRH
jgi:chromosome segregation ATPase